MDYPFWRVAFHRSKSISRITDGGGSDNDKHFSGGIHMENTRII